MDDPTAQTCAMLAEMSGIGMMMLQVIGRKVAAADGMKPADAMMFETVSRTMRRNGAMRQKLYADSKKTPEQRAAEDIRRAEAAERARFRVRKPPAPPTGDAIIRREPGPSDRENLLSDMNERLLPRGFNDALTQQDVSAIVLDILKQMGIVPKNETWSAEMMAAEVSAVRAEMERREAERAEAPPEPAETTPAPGENPHPDPLPQCGRGGVAVWPETVLGGREFSDLLKGRGPPRPG